MKPPTLYDRMMARLRVAAGETVTHGQLLTAMYVDRLPPVYVQQAIATLINRARLTLGPDERIYTVRGAGYRYERTYDARR